MTLAGITRHLFNIMLKKHGGDAVAAAVELNVDLRTIMCPPHDPLDWSLPDDPMSDAAILVDMLREYLPQLPGDQRVLVASNLMDGYCRLCGTDMLPCHCFTDE